MTELFELIQLTERIFNRPFGILLIVAGLSFLLIAVLFELSDVRNRIANITAVTVGTILIITGAVMHLRPMTPPEPSALENQIAEIQIAEIQIANIKSGRETQTDDLKKPLALPEELPLNSGEAAESLKKTYLNYTEVSRFEFLWNNKTDETEQRAAFYRPLPPAGYKILGHYAQGDYDKPSGQVIAVRSLLESADEGILAYPVRYRRIWRGTRGTIWRPIPPVGYRCLGDVATPGNSEPDRKEVVCVREFLLTEGKPGKRIWNNRENNAVYDISVYPVLAKNSKGLGINLFQGYGRKLSRRSGYASFPVFKNDHIEPAQD